MNKYWNLLILALAAALIGEPGAARNEEPAASPESTRAYREGYNLILNRDWDTAIGHFNRLIDEYPQSSWVDDAAFWSCYARGQTNESAEAVFACYEQHVDRYRRSEWRDDARRAMVRLAGQLDQEGKPQYRRRVEDFGSGDDDRQLLQVLVALGEIGDERSVDVILQRLDQTTDEHLRARIIDVLEDIESPRILNKLTELATTDASELVRVAAVDAISEQQGGNVSVMLREIALDESQPVRVRIEAINELEDHRPTDIVDILSQLARSPNARVANEAIDELGDLESAAALAALSDLLTTIPDAQRRLEIVNSIEDFESDSAVQALVRVAGTDPDPRIRRAATDALGDMETAAAREALIELLGALEGE